MSQHANVLAGLVELHVHSSPDVRVRRMNDLELMETGVKNNVRAIVIKSHVAPTAGRAALVNLVRQEKYPESAFAMYGGVTLNQNVGGINPSAVDACLKIGGKIVWLPTFHAESHLRNEGKSGGVRCVENGRVVAPMQEVFKLVLDSDAVLATGHLSPAEIFIVVEAARNTGLTKILINHPESNLVGMTDEDQVRLIRDFGVFIERCYAQPIGGGKYKSNLPDNCRMFKQIGVSNFVVATDAGQVENPPWNEEVAEYVGYLLDNGISRSDVDVLTKKNPAMLLGLAD